MSIARIKVLPIALFPMKFQSEHCYYSQSIFRFFVHTYSCHSYFYFKRQFFTGIKDSFRCKLPHTTISRRRDKQRISAIFMKTQPYRPARPVCILQAGSVTGQKEKQGPLGKCFDLSGDDRFGKETWEKAESEMQRLAVGIALRKAGLRTDEIDALFAGDLINQCTASSYGLLSYRIPFLGLFGACSTCAEGLLMAAIGLGCPAGAMERAVAVTSSHFCSAERQFRFPLEYGGQRPPTAQWTVTGSGAFVLSAVKRDIVRLSEEYVPVIEEVMPGCIVDRGVTDANNMGAAMAPSAADTLERYFKGSGHTPDSFDLIATGDLGREGTAILRDLLEVKGIDITKHHVDCGCMIFSETESDTHAGGSGCGCSAVVLAADLLPNLRRGVLRDILFVGTGALMNPLSLNQGQPIPGIAHLIRIRAVPKREFSHKITEEISHADAP